MESLNLKSLVKKASVFFSFMMIYCHSALASTTGNLPFNNAADKFKDNFYAWIFVALLLMWSASCLMLAFGEWKDSVAKVLNFVFWGSLALGGPALAAAIFTTGAVF